MDCSGSHLVGPDIMKHLTTILALACGLALTYSLAKKQGKVPRQPVEVGSVSWGRDLDAALAKSGTGKKPVLVLFQEVPGCAGCKKFGSEVLTHPLLVEAIEDEFEPVLVYNNRSGGKDAELLKRFKEPAWNYQVIRFLKADGSDLIGRKDRIWTLPAVVGRMVEALEKAGREVPLYLKGLAPQAKTESAAFAMHCFWTGEYELGKIDGVVSTEAGWLEGREVTLVHYVPEQIDLAALTRRAAAVKCARKVFVNTPDERKTVEKLGGLEVGEISEKYRPAKSSDQSKQIQKLDLAKIPGLTELQRTKLNSLLPRDREKALRWLSPRQRLALDQLTGGKRD